VKIGIEAQRLVCLLVVAAPWLLPPVGGPSPSLVPWIFSLACMCLLIVLLPRKNLQGEASSVVPVAWLTAALISSAMGLSQYFGVAWQFVSWMSPPTAFGEAFANLRQRNQFATLTNIGLASLLWCAAHKRMSGTQDWRYRFSLPLAAALLAAGNAASSSRTGLLQLLLLAGFIWFWGGLRHAEIRRVLTVALVVYGAATGLLPIVRGGDSSGWGLWGRLGRGDADCASRLTLWGNVLHLIGQRPWLGWGWGELDYAHFMTHYDGLRFCEILGNAHNLPLHLAVELGVPIALLVCGGAIWLVLRARPWLETNPNRQLAWGVLALILLHSQLEYPLWYGPFQMGLLLCLVLLWPLPRSMPEKIAGAQEKYRSVSIRILAGSLLASVAYVAWDYWRISQIYLPLDQRAVAYREQTLEKIRGSWLFRDQVRFAEFTITPLTQNNAEQLHAMGLQLLHFSPEARVVEKLIECAVMLGRDEEARFYLGRYKDAYPQEHARWAAAQQPVQHQD